jgi:hypothetical protein
MWADRAENALGRNQEDHGTDGVEAHEAASMAPGALDQTDCRFQDMLDFSFKDLRPLGGTELHV